MPGKSYGSQSRERKQDGHGECRPNAQPRIPRGHFNDDGVSQGKQTGPIRAPDAYQGPRKGESD